MSVTILVVDDLADMRSLLGLTLQRAGWNIIEATNGQEAFEVALNQKPDLILMDYDMPGTNGLRSCEMLAGEPQTADIPIIIYTGHSSAHVREDVLEAGARSFLLKPIPASQLRDEVRKLLSIEE